MAIKLEKDEVRLVIAPEKSSEKVDKIITA